MLRLINKIILVHVLLFGVSAAWAEGELSEMAAKLHPASKDIVKQMDKKAVIESVYRQLRWRTTTKDSRLSTAQIDKKVRQYVADKYVPSLLGNYSLVYQKLVAANKEFSGCDNPDAVSLSVDVKVVLCLLEQEEKDTIRVQYMTSGYGRGWTKSTVYVFRMKGNALRLSDIELQLKEGHEVYVEKL